MLTLASMYAALRAGQLPDHHQVVRLQSGYIVSTSAVTDRLLIDRSAGTEVLNVCLHRFRTPAVGMTR